MTAAFSVYCIANVSSPPNSLSRRENGAFYCHVPVPIAEQLVIFSEGDWVSSNNELQVTLTYKDDEIVLGKITPFNKCVVWRRECTQMPESMTCVTEKGLAKIVVDECDEVEQVDDVEPYTTIVQGLKEMNENTPQFSDESSKENKGPGRPKKRSSVNNDNKTPNGPNSKKQKTTRVRGKLGNAEKENSPSSDTNPNAGNAKKGKSPKVDQTDTSTRLKKKGNTKKSGEVGKGTPDKQPETEKDASKTVEKPDKLPQSIDINTEDSNGIKKRRKASEGKAKSDDTVFSKAISAKDTGNEKTVKSKGIDTSEKKTVKTDHEKVGKQKAEQRKSGTGMDTEERASRRPKRSCQEHKAETTNVNTDKDETNEAKGVLLDKNLAGIPRAQKPTRPDNYDQLKVAECKDITLRALDQPTKRWGHSLSFVNKNRAVLIGGQGENQQLCKDSVWTLDLETRRWKEPDMQVESQKPEYRMGHTATYDPLLRCIYVFGGSKYSRWFHDVHMLDTEEWKWQLVKVNGKAPTRAYHSATLYRHEVWIFGGVYPRPDPQPDGCSNDIHIFSPVMETWYSPLVSGEKPIPRSGHSATLLDYQLVIFGGWDAPISYSDLHILDMSIVEWSQPKVTGTPPSPRSWHASCGLSNKRVLIHGGYNGDFALEDTHIFNLAEMNWTQIRLDRILSARVGHECVCMPYRHDNGEEDEVIIFGGGDNDGVFFNDIYSIYIPFNTNIDSEDMSDS